MVIHLINGVDKDIIKKFGDKYGFSNTIKISMRGTIKDKEFNKCSICDENILKIFIKFLDENNIAYKLGTIKPTPIS